MEPTTRTALGPRATAGFRRLRTALPARLAAAALSLAVAVIHIKDQGGFPGDKQPTYVGIGYYVLELAAIVAAVMLIGKVSRSGWWLSLGVALGPVVAYVLSRGPGLPPYHDDRGNWTESLGLISLVVEGALLLISLAVLWAPWQRARADVRNTRALASL